MNAKLDDASNILSSKGTSILAALLLAVFTFSLTKLWIRIRELPPGPFPLPIIGNLLCFRTKKSLRDVLLDFKRTYGGIYTLWVSHEPIVIVADWKTAKEGLIIKRNDIVTRPNVRSLNHLCRFVSIGFDNGKKWETGRKIAACAIRKFTDSDKHAALIENCTVDMITQITKNERESFDPTHHLENLVTKLVADTAFGSENLTPDELREINSYNSDISSLAGKTPGDLSPVLLLFYYHRELKMKNIAVGFARLLTRKYEENKRTFRKGEIRNFSDAVLTAKLDAEEDGSEAQEFLTDNEMMKIMGALFFAGTETTFTTMRWIILLLGAFPDVQSKIREEIEKHIGERTPVESDRKNCPYTWAFVSEALRFRTAAPIGVPHTTSVDTKLNGHKIRKGTMVIFHADAIHSDTEVWREPEQFKPERFLNEDGSYSQERRQGFMAFGEGRRLCIGEKIGRNSLFLIVANLLRRVDIRLDQPPDTVDLEPRDNVMVNMPKPYRVTADRRT